MVGCGDEVEILDIKISRFIYGENYGKLNFR